MANTFVHHWPMRGKTLFVAAAILVATGCDPATITPECAPGTSGCACTVADACDGDLVCDSETSRCREAKACAQAGCVSHQVCNPSTSGQDATCLPQCESGFRWNATTQACDAVVCDATNVGTEGCPCTNLGLCNGDLVCDSVTTTCRAADHTCQCKDHQLCETLPGADATCLAGCEEGYDWNPTLQECEPEEADPCDGYTQCADQNRECELDASDEPMCTDCLDGYAEESPGGPCIERTDLVTCEDLSAQCAAVDCIAAPGVDGLCILQGQTVCDVLEADPVCPAGHAYRPGHGCMQCLLDCPDEEPLYPVTTATGGCICTTRGDWYFAPGDDAGNEECDADGDGWVRIGAHASLTSSDCAIRNNARCVVNEIDRFLLIGDDGNDVGPQDVEVIIADSSFISSLAVDGKLPLYEVAANDSFDHRGPDTYYPDLIPYNTTPATKVTRTFSARELNSLTKACAGIDADHNGNRIPDILESHGMAVDDGLNRWLKAFVHFSYYLELFEGYFVPSGTGEPGQYVIREKTRSAPPDSAQQVPLTGEGEWQTCWRRRELAYDEQSTENVGMDFAYYNRQSNGFGTPVFGHSSQFKCLDTATAELDRFTANGCSIDDALPVDSIHLGVAEAGDISNPYSPVLTCDVVDTPDDVPVVLGVAKYQHYTEDPVDADDGYIFGCINECVDQEYLPADEQCENRTSGGWGCTPDPVSGKANCFYHAGCADCTWNGSSWDCTPDHDLCGNCGACVPQGDDPPVWTCEEATASIQPGRQCTGDCSDCARVDCSDPSCDVDYTFTCEKVPAECFGVDLGHGSCGECTGSGRAFSCGYQPNQCPSTHSTTTTCTLDSGDCAEEHHWTRTTYTYTCQTSGQYVGYCSRAASSAVEKCGTDLNTDGDLCGAKLCGQPSCRKNSAYPAFCDHHGLNQSDCSQPTCGDAFCGNGPPHETVEGTAECVFMVNNGEHCDPSSPMYCGDTCENQWSVRVCGTPGGATPTLTNGECLTWSFCGACE